MEATKALPGWHLCAIAVLALGGGAFVGLAKATTTVTPVPTAQTVIIVAAPVLTHIAQGTPVAAIQTPTSFNVSFNSGYSSNLVPQSTTMAIPTPAQIPPPPAQALVVPTAVSTALVPTSSSAPQSEVGQSNLSLGPTPTTTPDVDSSTPWWKSQSRLLELNAADIGAGGDGVK